MPLAQTIDEVISSFDDVIAWAHQRKSPVGYFAAIYRGVTKTIKQRISEGAFQDNERMARFDVTFANRYLDAFRAWRDGDSASVSWVTSFRKAEDPKLIILQHLLLGVNAHMNLDLGCAASAVAPGNELPSLEPDFVMINDILGGLVDQDRLAVEHLSPGLKLIDRVGALSDFFVDLDIEQRRHRSWRVAQHLAQVAEGNRTAEIATLDSMVARQCDAVVKPPFVLREFINVFVRPREKTDVCAIIEALG